MKRKLAAACLCLLLVSGCAPSRQISSTQPTTTTQALLTRLPGGEMTATATSAATGTPEAGKVTASPISATETRVPTALPQATLAYDGLSLEKTIQYDPWTLVHDLRWSPDGTWLAVAGGEKIFLYDGNTFESVGTLEIGAWANEIQFLQSESQPGWILGMAVRDGTLQFWDIERTTLLAKFSAHNKAANSLAISPDNRLVASSGNDAILRMWDQEAIWEQAAEDLSPAAEMIGGAFAVPAVRFSPDGSLVASIDLQVVRLRDPASTRLVRTLYSDKSLFDIAFSPDGSYLAAARSGSSILVWQVDTGEAYATWETGEAENAFLWSLAFSSDGRRLCAVSNLGGIYLWSFPQGERLAGVMVSAKAISAAAFSPDGERLATGGLDAQVRLWKLAEGGE